MSIDNELKIKRGDIKALERFFHHSHARLVNYALLFVPDKMIASDIVQEAFIHFWNKRKEIRVGKSVEALIFTAVRNRCLNYIRNQKTFQNHLEQYKSENSDLQHVTQYDFLGYEEETLEEMLLKLLEKSIDELPEKSRQIFILNKIEGVKQKDIAKQLGISIKTVEKHIRVAKSKLQKHMEKKYPLLGTLITFFIEF